MSIPSASSPLEEKSLFIFINLEKFGYVVRIYTDKT